MCIINFKTHIGQTLPLLNNCPIGRPASHTQPLTRVVIVVVAVEVFVCTVTVVSSSSKGRLHLDASAMNGSAA